MKHYNKDIGNYGEDLACNYLINNKYSIIYRNFHCKSGEIDIIAMKDNTLIFIEVKSRYNKNYGLALLSVNYKKQMKIRNVAKYFIHINNMYKYNVRFDVCEIYFNYYDDTYSINYINNAF